MRTKFSGQQAESLSGLVTLISEHRPKLPPKQRTVADLITANTALVSYATVQQIAEEAGVNVATVVRFCRSLGFSGYAHFRDAIRHYYLNGISPWEVLESETVTETEPPVAQRDGTAAISVDWAQRSLAQDLANLRHLSLSLPKQVFTSAVDALCSAPRILCIGSGNASPPRVLASLLNYVGRPADFDVQAGTSLGQKLNFLAPGDLLVSFGFFRCHPVVVKATVWARQQGITTLTVTDSVLSPLSHAGQLVLLVPTEGTSFFQSSVAPMALVNALAAAVAARTKGAAAQHLKRGRQIYRDIGLPGQRREEEETTTN